MRLLVIIPAYNEAENLSATIADIQNEIPDADYVIVNDCSIDETVQICTENNYNILNLPVNLGIGGGVQTGYQYALAHNYDIAIQFDGDGQHEACYIKDLIEPIENGQADFVIGSRFIKKEGFQTTGMRRFGINFLSGLIHFLCGIRVLDVTSGMRAVDKKMIKVFSENYAQDYPEPEAILYSGMHGARIVEVPVQMRERKNGVSSINPLRSIYYMIKVSLALVLSRMSGTKRETSDD